MDLRMLKDYLRIFWKSWLGVTISYAAICGLVADRDYPVTFFLWLAFLSLGSFVWIHFFHFQGWRSSGLLFALPISRRQLAHTVWFEVIGISTIAASFVFAAQWLALGLSFHPWTLKIGHLFLPFVFTGLLLTNGYWFFLAAFEKSRHTPLSSILSITVFIGYCYCSFMLLRYWPASNIMSVLLILCGLFITIFSFIYSELILGLILNPSRIPAHINHGKVEKKHCESSSRINCWWAHPARIVVSETWLIIIVPYALLALAKGLLPANAITRSDILPLIMCCVTSIAALVMFVLGPTLDALRLWATTPVSRTTMAVTFITLPFIALFPVVVILMVESRLQTDGNVPGTSPGILLPRADRKGFRSSSRNKSIRGSERQQQRAAHRQRYPRPNT